MSATVTVALDAAGADRGPREVARAAALASTGDVRVILFGPREELGPVPAEVEVVDAPVSIAKVADPARAVRAHPEASIVQAVRAVANGRADALVSGGSTGSALAAGLFHVKRAPGIHRPALAAVIPVPGAPFLLLDCGANLEVRPELLVQFAHMGTAFMEGVLGMERPRVALLSVGEEPTRGPAHVLGAHEALAAAGSGINFVGNVEGYAVGRGAADVIVADGYAGNVALKVMEGSSSAMLGFVKRAAMASPRGRLGGLLLRRALRGLRDEVDPQLHGGAVLLGLRKVAVVPHGAFEAHGFAQSVEVAARGVREDVVGRTHARLAAAGALRPVPGPSAPGDASGALASVPDRS